MTPAGVDRPAVPPVRRGVGRPRHLERRIHPDHRAPARRRRPAVPRPDQRQRLHLQGHLPGPLLRAVRAVLRARGAPGRQPVPGPPDPARGAGGGELLLPAQRVRAAAHRLVRGEPGRGPAGVEAQRGAQLHQGRAQRHLDHPDLHRLGGAGPVGRRPRLLRLVRRPDQLRHGHRLRRGPRALRRVVAERPPPHRQGDHPVPLRVVAGHVHGSRDRPPGPRPGPRLAPPGRGRRCPTRVSTASPRPTCAAEYGVDPRPLPPAAGRPARERRRVLRRGALGPLQRRPGQQPWQPAPRVVTVVGTKCGGVGPHPTRAARSPRWPPRCRPRRRPPGTRRTARWRSRPPGG